MPTHFCDTPGSIFEALDALRKASFLLVDCEGFRLGSALGQLSIISIGTPNAENIYLIDVLSLSQSEIQPILNILDDERRTKYVWDGRLDNRELLESFNISIMGAVDLTLVDIISRATRGEGEEERKERLAIPMHPLSQIKQLQTAGVHRLNSMRYVCNQREHDVDLDGVTHTFYSIRMKPDYESFMDRPLRRDLRDYAVSDIEIMARLHTKFSEEGYLSNTRQLQDQTCRFFETIQGRVPLNDPYKASSLLPLEVLDKAPYTGSSFTCELCNRYLSEASFVRKTLKHRGRTGVCKVCYILQIRKKLEEHRERQREEYDDYYVGNPSEYSFGGSEFDDYNNS